MFVLMVLRSRANLGVTRGVRASRGPAGAAQEEVSTVREEQAVGTGHPPAQPWHCSLLLFSLLPAPKS